jgi:hypothetical protein
LSTVKNQTPNQKDQGMTKLIRRLNDTLLSSQKSDAPQPVPSRAVLGATCKNLPEQHLPAQLGETLA